MVLAIGCVHGDECAGVAAVRRAYFCRRPDTGDLVVVRNLNPDGSRSSTPAQRPRRRPEPQLRRRLAADRRSRRPRALRAAAVLGARVPARAATDPRAAPGRDDLVSPAGPSGCVRAWGPSMPAARAYARLAGEPFVAMPWLDGTAPNWQNHRFAAPSSFVVELPEAGRSTPSATAGDLRARRRAVEGRRWLTRWRSPGERGTMAAGDERRARLRAPRAPAAAGPASRPRARARSSARRSAARADALEELFRRHWRRAHRAAYLVVGDAAAAEDIAQESFLAAIRALDRFDRRRPFGPWLHRIAVNRAIDFAPRPGAARRERALGPPSRARGRRSPAAISDELLARSPSSRPSTGRWSCSATCSSTRRARSARCSACRAGPSTRGCGAALDRLRPALEEERDERRPRARASALRDAARARRGRGRGARPGRSSAPPTPSARRRRCRRAPRRVALALAAWRARLLAIGLSPAGREGRRPGRRATRRSGSAREDAKPALRSLPAAGELLVESEQGPWIVREDGSKRLLGDYDEATWSPRGLFVAVAEGRELIAVEPAGERALDDRRARRRSATRAGAGSASTPDRLPQRRRPLGRRRRRHRRAAGRPRRRAGARRPGGRSGATRSSRPPAPGRHVLTLRRRASGEIADDRRRHRRATAETARRDRRAALGAGGRRHRSGRRHLARRARRWPPIRARAAARASSCCSRDARRPRRVLFSARGRLTGPTWSPDGRWLLVGWPAGRPVAVHPRRAPRRRRRDRPDLRAVRPRRQRRAPLPARQRLDPARSAERHDYGSGGSRSWCAGVKKLR